MWLTCHNATLQQVIAKSHYKRMSCSLTLLDGGPAPEPPTARRWRGDALRHTKEEEAHQIRDPSVPWQRVGGETTPSCIGGGVALRGPPHVGGGRRRVVPSQEARRIKRCQLRRWGDSEAAIMVLRWCNEEREVLFLRYLSPPLQKWNTFVLPVEDGCHMYSVPSYLTLFCICNVLLESILEVFFLAPKKILQTINTFVRNYKNLCLSLWSFFNLWLTISLKINYVKYNKSYSTIVCFIMYIMILLIQLYFIQYYRFLVVSDQIKIKIVWLWLK
jgi:hypothetical protein